MEKRDIDKKLEEALKTDFEFNLPDNFTDKVLVKVETQNNLAVTGTDRNLYWLLFAAGFFMFITCLVTMLIYTDIDVLQYISQYGGYVLFTIGLIAIIQFLDNKLVKEKLGVSKLN